MTPPTDCTCFRCVEACRKQPGWFKPGEAEKAAELLGLPFDEFKKFIVMDHADNEKAPTAPYVWAPRKVGVDQPVDELRSHYTQRKPGVCVFLKDGRCSIHAAKPFECRETLVCEPGGWGLRDDIEQAWIEAGAPLGLRPEYEYDDE
jgi:Fe-S-cluster containining protein